MIIKVDWISFSIPTTPREDDDERSALYDAGQAIADLEPELPELLEMRDSWQPANGRAPYRTAWRPDHHGWTLFTHPRLPHALVEISGKGCDILAEVLKQQVTT